MTHPAGAWSPEQYRPYLELLARSQLKGWLRAKVDASDVVQEAMLKAHEKRTQFAGASEGEYKGWLRRILANQLVEIARSFATDKRDAARERSLEAALDESSLRLEKWLAADTASPSTRLRGVEEFARLAEALAQLSEDQRQAVQLHHLDGLSVEEVRQQMGRSKAAVGSLLYHGMKRLRELLEE